MAQNTKIQWAHHTANLWWGCTEVHAGCDNCYAKKLAHRYGFSVWGKESPRKEIKSVWSDLLKFQNKAAKSNEKHRVFVGSMMDIFEKPMPLIDNSHKPITQCHCDVCNGTYTTNHLRQWLFNVVVPNSPNLIFLFLTKRPRNINKYIPQSWLQSPPSNVMYGMSVVDNETVNTHMKHFIKVKGRKFLSVEPQIDSVNIQGYLSMKHIDWVIQGGESGHGKRPFNIDWAYYMQQQCNIAKVPYFFKQIDGVNKDIPEALQQYDVPIF
jgi:protein gp37